MPAALPRMFSFVFYLFWCLLSLVVAVLLAVSAAWKAPAYHVLEFGGATMALLCSLLPFFSFGRRLLQKPFDTVRWLFSGYLRPVLIVSLLTVIAIALWPKQYTPAVKPAAKVALIGGGSAGVHAAWVLYQNGVDFQLFEATDYIGGHALAQDFPIGGKEYPIDLGFIFGAPSSYKEFKALIALNGLERTPSRLSYYARVKGTEWATESPETLSAEAERFHRLAEAAHDDPSLNLVPFGWWLKWHGFSDKFRETHLTPMLAILFVSIEGFYEQSTRFILNMYSGKGKWIDYRNGASSWVIKGSSREYYQRLTEPFKDRLRLLSPVTRVERKNGKVIVTWVDSLSQRRSEEFSSVILATPADVTRRILDTEWWENWALAQVRYTPVIVEMHGDGSILPAEKMRRAFHYIQHTDDPMSFELVGRMNEVFGYGKLDPEPLISLNPRQRALKPIVSRVWRHHTQDLWHIAMMEVFLTQMQGRGNVYYAGDWVKFIGHGFAMRTGMNAACRISGIKNAAELKNQPKLGACRDVTVIDARDADDKEEKIRICSAADAYRYVTAISCGDMLPAEQRIEP